MQDTQIFSSPQTGQVSKWHAPQGRARSGQPIGRNNPGWHVSKQMLLGFSWNIHEIEMPPLNISISTN